MCAASTWIQSNIFASIVQFNHKAKQPLHFHHYLWIAVERITLCRCAHDHLVILNNSECCCSLLVFNHEFSMEKSPHQIIIMRNRNEMKWKSHHSCGSSDIGHLTWWFGGFIVFSIDTFYAPLFHSCCYSLLLLCFSSNDTLKMSSNAFVMRLYFNRHWLRQQSLRFYGWQSIRNEFNSISLVRWSAIEICNFFFSASILSIQIK